MTPSRSIQSAAFALALTITLATLGSLNLLAQDQHAGNQMAKATQPQHTAATQAPAANLRS